MTTLSLIVAHDHNHLIGVNGDLPWRLPADLQQFKALTTGKTVLMGRKTWLSLPRRPLPGRDNWVLSQQGLPAEVSAGAQVFPTLEAALAAAEQGGVAELMVIGGARLYAQCLPLAQRIYLTHVHASLTPAASDEAVYFPAGADAAFQCRERRAYSADDRHAYAFDFKVLERKPCR